MRRHFKDLGNPPERTLKCHECGDVVKCQYIPDPYMEDIEGDDTKMWICEVCACTSAMDI